MAVVASWKLGQKGKDNGVLLVVVPSERKMRIEVGYGLEGRLTDVHSNRIIRNVLAPRFKAGDFDGGIEDGVKAILANLRGEAVEGAEPGAQQASAESLESAFKGPDLSITERILFGAFIFGIIGLFTVIGVLTPGMGWFIYIFLIPFYAMFPIVVVGVQGALMMLVVYLIAFPVAQLVISRTASDKTAQKDMKTKGHAKIGGFVLGGSSGS